MKQLFLSALLAVFISSSAFSAGENTKEKELNFRTLNNFKAEFGDLSNVTWSVKQDFAKATFTYNEVSTEAFFDGNGELIGTSRPVNIADMPVNVKRVFAKRYADYTVKETIRFDGPEESSYYISADNGAKSVILKVSVDGGVSLYRSVAKK